MTTGLPWRRSQTNRAQTSTCRRPVPILVSLRRFPIPRWSCKPGGRARTHGRFEYDPCGGPSLGGGKLFHIDLNDQIPGRYDQDLSWVGQSKGGFLAGKFLEDVGYEGPRAFDAHAYRTEDYDGVKEFARGCMRTYLILKDKAASWNADPEIKTLLAEIAILNEKAPSTGSYRKEDARSLLQRTFDRAALASKACNTNDSINSPSIFSWGR